MGRRGEGWGKIEEGKGKDMWRGERQGESGRIGGGEGGGRRGGEGKERGRGGEE